MSSDENKKWIELFKINRQQNTETILFDKNPFNINEYLGTPTGLIVINSEREIVFINDVLSTSNAPEFLLGQNLDLNNLDTSKFSVNLIIGIVDTSANNKLIASFFLKSKTTQNSPTNPLMLNEALFHYPDLFEDYGVIKKAIKASNFAIWDYDPVKNITYVNEFYAKLIGYKPGKFKKGWWIQKVHPDDLNSVQMTIEEHINGKTEHLNYEYRIKTEDGGWKWINTRAKFFNKEKRLIGTFLDITDRKFAEKKYELLYRIMNISTDSELDLPDKIKKILIQIKTSFGYEASMVHIFNNTINRLELIGMAGNQDSRFLEKGISLINKIYSSGELIEPKVDFKLHSGNTHLIYIPILLNKTMAGVLSIFKEKTDHSEIELYKLIANHIGTIIERENLKLKIRETAIIQERQRLARDLHDSLNQSLYSLSLISNGGYDFLTQKKYKKVEETFSQIDEIIQETQKELRYLIFNLKPSVLEEEGLESAIKNRLMLVEKRAGIQFEFKYHLNGAFSTKTESNLYNVIIEALNNIVKHSQSDRLLISISELEESIEVLISDFGIGFDLNQIDNSNQGIKNIISRVQNMDGDLHFNTKPGKGCNIQMFLPKKLILDTIHE